MYGRGSGDDAGVYLLREGCAIVQSVDFFTPIVEDPYLFGQIAAVNALSDIFVVGAKPVTALNLLSIPHKLDLDVAGAILRGGAQKVHQAGALIAGGHTINDKEPKYGLCVTGIVDPAKMITNRGAKPGEKLLLTKKLGTGIICSMIKKTGSQMFDSAIESMLRLNESASRLMLDHDAGSATDVTGFGLLGHASNLAQASGVSLSISADALPVFDGIEKFAVAGTKGGGERNLKWVRESIRVDKDISREKLMVMCDPQTSGGFLISIKSDKAEDLLDALKESGDENSAIIGEVTEPADYPLIDILP